MSAARYVLPAGIRRIRGVFMRHLGGGSMEPAIQRENQPYRNGPGAVLPCSRPCPIARSNAGNVFVTPTFKCCRHSAIDQLSEPGRQLNWASLRPTETACPASLMASIWSSIACSSGGMMTAPSEVLVADHSPFVADHDKLRHKRDRESTRLNSRHTVTSYAVF